MSKAKRNKQTSDVPAWKPESKLSRANMCRSFLVIHGFISDRENQRVLSRLGRAYEKQRKATP